MELAIVAGALIFVAWREREHSKERRHLLDRIQAPGMVTSVFDGLEPGPAHVPFDNDEEFFKAQGHEE